MCFRYWLKGWDWVSLECREPGRLHYVNKHRLLISEIGLISAWIASIVYFFLSCCCLSLLHVCHHHQPWWPEEQSDGRGYCRCCLGRWPHNANVALRIWPSSDPPTGGQPLSSKWPGSNVNRWVADSQHTTTTIAPPDSVIARPRNPNPRIRIVPTSWCLGWSSPEIEGWPGRVSVARSASTGQSPFGGRLAGGCALNSAPPMAAASGGAGKGVRGFSAWWEGPLWATSTLWPLPLNTSTHFFTPAWETTGSAGLSRWSLQKSKTDSKQPVLCPMAIMLSLITSDHLL